MQQSPNLKRKQEEERYRHYRIKMLPEQLERAYRRVEALQREAIRLGMQDLLREIRP